MSRYDGLIIPRSYSEYINKTDAATLQQALQLSGVLSGTVQSGDNKPVKSDAVYKYIHNKTVLFIGDSYGDSAAIVNPWYPLVTSQIQFYKTYRLTKGGHGFTGKDGAPSGTTGASLRWITDLTNFVNAHTQTELAEINEVYIIGGFNDIYSTYENILSYMQAFFTYAKQNLPNAQFFVGMSGWCDYQDFSTPNTTYQAIRARLRLSTIVARAYRECGRYGVAYMGDLFLALHEYGSDFDNSHYHPSAAGAAKLANAICSYIQGRSFTIGTIEVPEVFLEKTSLDDEGTEKTFFICRQNNNVIALTNFGNAPSNQRTVLSFTTVASFSKGNSTLINLSNTNKDFIFKSGLYLGKDGSGSAVLYVDIATDGNDYKPGYLYISGSNGLVLIPTFTIAANTLVNVRVRSAMYMAEIC